MTSLRELEFVKRLPLLFAEPQGITVLLRVGPHLTEIKVRATAVLSTAYCVLRKAREVLIPSIIDAAIYFFIGLDLRDPISNFPEPGIYLRPLSFDGDEPKAIMNIFVYQSCVNPTCLEFLTILMIAGIEVSVHL